MDIYNIIQCPPWPSFLGKQILWLVPQTPLGGLNKIQWKSGGFKEENPFQVSGQTGKSESPINAFIKAQAEDEPCSAAGIQVAQPWGPAPQGICLQLSCCTRATHIPAAALTWPLFSKHLLFFKNLLFLKFRAFFDPKNAPSVLPYSLGWWGLHYNQTYIQKSGLIFSSFPWYSHWPQPLAFVWLIMFWLYSSPSPCTLSLSSKLPLWAEHLGCAI